MKTTSILIVGVGGQGTLLASRIIGKMAVAMGFDVKVSEVHGMAQRGGSVVTHVRFGDKVFSPIVPSGEADYILAFELLEGGRYANELKNDGLLLINEQRITPMPVITGAMKYPENIPDSLTEAGVKLQIINAAELAQQAGNLRTVNVIMIGLLSTYMDIPIDIWLNALKASVKPQLYEINEKAFLLGRSIKIA